MSVREIKSSQTRANHPPGAATAVNTYLRSVKQAKDVQHRVLRHGMPSIQNGVRNHALMLYLPQWTCFVFEVVLSLLVLVFILSAAVL